MASTDDLAADLGVDEGDVLSCCAGSASRPRTCPTSSRLLAPMLDPHGERTAPAGLYWPGADDEPQRVYGLGGPDPRRRRRPTGLVTEPGP